jgi:polar amino acid transport system permease protein
VERSKNPLTPGTPTPDSALTANRIEAPATTFDKWWLLVIGVIVLLVLLVTLQPDPYRRAFNFVQDGILMTITVTTVSFLLVVVLGLIGGLGRLSKNRFINGIATLYVEVVRGVPLLVQLLAWYFAVPQLVQRLGTQLNIPFMMTYRPEPVIMAIVGLTICYGAYMSEIYRAGIQSIGKGQMEAARSLGMSQTQAMRYIVLPQAVRVILPPLGNEFISLLKDSSLVSVVGVADLTRRGREFMGQTATPIETWTVVALLYLVMTILSARVVNWIEKKTQDQER